MRVAPLYRRCDSESKAQSSEWQMIRGRGVAAMSNLTPFYSSVAPWRDRESKGYISEWQVLSGLSLIHI